MGTLQEENGDRIDRGKGAFRDSSTRHPSEQIAPTIRTHSLSFSILEPDEALAHGNALLQYHHLPAFSPELAIELLQEQKKGLAQEEEKRQECLPIEQPTSTTTFKWLGLGVGSGIVTGISLGAASAAYGMNYLSSQGASSKIMMVGITALAAIGIRGVSRVYNPMLRLKLVNNDDKLEHQRLKKLIGELDKKDNYKDVRVFATKQIKNAGIIDAFGKKDTLLVNPEFSKKLSDRELKGVLAHELCHSNKLYTGLSDTSATVSSVGLMSVQLAAMEYVSQTVLNFSGFFGEIVNFGGSVASFTLSGFAAGLLIKGGCALASRSNELRTDIRAIEMTQDPASYFSALDKTYHLLEKSLTPFQKSLRKISKTQLTHPSLKERKHWMKRAAGLR